MIPHYVYTRMHAYMLGISEQSEKVLKKEKVRLVYKKGRTVGNLLCNTKPKRSDSKDVVYKGRCETCNMVYIGETSQWLKTRIN